MITVGSAGITKYIVASNSFQNTFRWCCREFYHYHRRLYYHCNHYHHCHHYYQEHSHHNSSI